MINFKVDESKCIHCGLCSSDCPALIIDNQTEFPTIKEGKEDNCLKCQHCLAICPSGAISILGKEPENSIPVTNEIPDSNEMEKLMKTRRSIRKFKPEALDKELIYQMISVASYAPTGHNDNAVRFSVVESRTEFDKLRNLVYDGIKKANEEMRIPKSMLFLNNFQAMWEMKNIDVLFRDAPHLLITSAPKNCASPQLDCGIAMTYFDLLANSNGIGTLWDGFAKMVIEGVIPEVKKMIGIPEDHKIGAVLLFGKASVKYARSIQNDNPEIKRISL